jgi:hypothetical protein
MEATSRYFWEADRERWAWEHIEDDWRSWGWAETEETAKQAAVDGKHPDCVQSFRKRPTGNLRSMGPSEQREVVGPDGTVYRRRSFLIYANRQQV